MRVYLFILVTLLMSQGVRAQQSGTTLRGNQNPPLGQKPDTFKMEYFPPPARIIYKPRISVPDSMLPLRKDVKVIVRAVVDPSGKPVSTRVLRSSDARFNTIARKLVLEYRLDAKGALRMYKTKSFVVVIPITFNKTKAK